MKLDDNMFFGATSEVFQKAKMLRKNLTEEEKMLWQYLKRNPKEGYRFRKQHPIYQYVVDFYCHKARLAIEIDGPDHQEQDKKIIDETRTEELNNLGIRVIRFTNEEVRYKIEKVYEVIKQNLH